MENERSRSIKTPTIVLRRLEYSEADFVLTLFTPYHGKLSAIAKGVRKPTSKLSGHVELYSYSKMLLAKGRNLHVVNQVDLLNPFLELGTDLQHIGYASHFVELIDHFTIDNEENLAAFHVLLTGLGWLTETDVDLQLAARYFELKLLEVMGYAPSLFVCAMSGRKLEAHDQFYSATDGGVITYELGKDYSGLIHLPLPAFKILRHLARHTWEDVRHLKISPTHHQIIERALHSTITYVLERNLQSVAFLRRVASLHNDSK